eukprot:TRINITY_DN1617_c0_g1_i2.p1 TRINITY_DN1617_c0_g1~~TRINITY_DN1617_c0_g1_i2.p1  ORF type:complete len:597 (-),score=165.26 TRINITY_DN1617_c0_g1_i2:4-1794(-)
MIAPRFWLDQDDQFVYLHLKVKYIKASTADWYILENEFKFHCKPYFLKLVLPFPCVEDGRESARYDMEKGQMDISLPKAQVGQFYPNLDMLTTLREARQTGPAIEVLNKMKVDEQEMDKRLNEMLEHPEGEEDWTLPQMVVEEKEEDGLEKVFYGFNNQVTSFFEKSDTDFSEIIDNPQPDSIKKVEIKKLRTQQEDEVFNMEHYIVDYLEDDEIQDILDTETKWERFLQLRLQQKQDITLTVTDSGNSQSNNVEIVQISSSVLNEEGITKQDVLNTEKKENTIGPAPLPQPLLMEPPSNKRNLIQVISETRFDTSKEEMDEDDPWNTEEAPPPSLPNNTTPVDPKPQIQIENNVIILPPDQNRLFLERKTEKDFKTQNQRQVISEKLIQFTEHENEMLMRLPNKEYLIENPRATMMSLLDIIYSITYDYLVMGEEDNPESAANIAKISPTLSWFDTFNNPKETLTACFRRSLCFPLYRHWKLCKKAFSVTKVIFRLGKRALIKSLLHLRHLFQFSETHHILNRLYIDDYCIWIQKISYQELNLCYKEISKTIIKKEDLSWNLSHLEYLALASQKEQKPIDLNSFQFLLPPNKIKN